MAENEAQYLTETARDQTEDRRGATIRKREQMDEWKKDSGGWQKYNKRLK